jgi:hypothetical protein
VLDPGRTDWGLELLHDPLRLELKAGVTLTYAEHSAQGYDVTLRADIEHHNFGIVHSDTPLGWMTGEPRRLFSALDATGRCAVDRLVRSDAGILYPARGLKLFMITTNALIAETDCLFYAVADDGQTIT